jgi:hypothetical protein
MVLQTADLLAFWVQAAQQNPVVVQFAQNQVPVQVQMVPEKGLAIASWIGPVISGLLSFFVAWMVFHWQGKKEHKQWLRDQKKAEWSQLLRLLGEIKIKYFPVFKDKKTASNLVEASAQIVDDLDSATVSFLFTDSKLLEAGFYEDVEKLQIQLKTWPSQAKEWTKEERIRLVRDIGEAKLKDRYVEISDQFYTIFSEVKSYAKKDL